MKREEQLIKDYFNGRLDVNIKCSKLQMDYLKTDDDTKLKAYEAQKTAVEKVLLTLTPVQLQTITMHDKDNMTWQNISDKIGVKRYVLENLKSKVLKELNTRLEA
ncbi:sigma-70 family RNA polymerase sigma factor [Weissella paramesenteroides]|uniref:sigma-70 family RNA polymerase sigma factor n=1 Tax=Weissella paramesenteroides TaxID=1249 RepID=UPI00123BCAC5|nr:sigma-70 family RNA polymerase sigma factor [Weissella paramesenteroides]KAA8457453.1 sigma-70 family RNA polymerase sigma factor [Weissella paramesenteroides]KAA8458916.1 sigma-70 family RNA polymerase sigma factor [Weissella paramesenteroides]KAA8460592.1 sigma-70 family RNA polymerase sigma factor [Weissella paramesenteroides]KAA8460865.1 sigma-70 family RNA polymerase sigma factor [Weissella paramesenteroides]KAA8462618.1 sigma-70 family RNA polymerase sigma factor [Weissella paramesent